MNISDRVLLIANPTSKNGAAFAAAQEAYVYFQEHCTHVELRCTEYPGHATDIASVEGPGFQSVIAIGGDGVIHEVVNGLMKVEAEHRPAFGLIPVGSGNDYARTIGMSENLDRALYQLLAAEATPTDLGVCNGQYFTETISFGLDAAIAIGTMERRKRTGRTGTILYLEEGLNQLFNHLDNHPFNLEITEGPDADGSVRLGEVIMFAVQVGPTYGGGFRICPDADPRDGVLDICMAHGPIGTLRATKVFLSAKDGKHVGHPAVEMLKASALRLHFSSDPACQIDGEEYHAEEYEISVVPNALNVYVPKK